MSPLKKTITTFSVYAKSMSSFSLIIPKYQKWRTFSMIPSEGIDSNFLPLFFLLKKKNNHLFRIYNVYIYFFSFNTEIREMEDYLLLPQEGIASNFVPFLSTLKKKNNYHLFSICKVYIILSFIFKLPKTADCLTGPS